MPRLTVTRVRYREDEVWEGSIPVERYDEAVTEEIDYESPEEAARAVRDLGATEWSGDSRWQHGWFGSPDGAQDVDYASGEVEEVSVRLSGDGGQAVWLALTGAQDDDGS